MKILFYFILLISVKNIYCQNKDTLFFENFKFSPIKIFKSGFVDYNNDTHPNYRILPMRKSKRIKKNYEKRVSFDNLILNNDSVLCIFRDEKSRIIEIGYWKFEYFVGKYKSFYKNGKLKWEKEFDSFGTAIGLWKRYRRNGQLKYKLKYKEGVLWG